MPRLLVDANIAQALHRSRGRFQEAGIKLRRRQIVFRLRAFAQASSGLPAPTFDAQNDVVETPGKTNGRLGALTKTIFEIGLASLEKDVFANQPAGARGGDEKEYAQDESDLQRGYRETA